jgi:predicted amidophosphoribosyltransferase
VCAHCQDPVSAAEESTGVCTNCGEPWQSKQSVKIWATSVPWASGGVM